MGFSREVCYLSPKDDAIEQLDYDFELLAKAVWYRKRTGESFYRRPEELVTMDDDYQAQCRIYEHHVDSAIDYDSLPSHLKSGG